MHNRRRRASLLSAERECHTSAVSFDATLCPPKYPITSPGVSSIFNASTNLDGQQMQKSDAVRARDDMMLLQAPIFSATEVCLSSIA
jgi:hypothetical protein